MTQARDVATDRATRERPRSLMGPGYRGATVGAVALVFLAAFESLAVATVMPTVTADLDGREWYAVAFSATLAASVVAMVGTGMWTDRRGAVPALLTDVGLFALGLLAAGLAPTMLVLVAARFLQGLGAGGLTVALYVLVAQVFEPADRPRILGLFAAAWVLPGLVGPFLAGLVADTVGWRWVFLGVVALALGALAAMVPSLRGVTAPEHSPDSEVDPIDPRRFAWAVVVAGAVVALNLAGGLDGLARLVAATLAVVVAVLAVRPLLPPGTLRGARGLPSVVAVRGLLGAAFFAAEAYLPYLLQEQYGATAYVSGLVLTVATLGWAAASQVQGRLGERLSDSGALQVGTSLLLVGVLSILAITSLALPGWLVGAGWVVAAAGMGLAFPRTTAAVLARSSSRTRGSGSSALTISDAVGSAAAVAVAGLVFTAVGTAADRGAFVAVVVCAAAISVVGLLVARRT